jgi:hypothetical protein
MTAKLEAIFPGLVGSGYRVTSPAAKRYNCIAAPGRESPSVTQSASVA